jgi:hypothetical protein
MSESVPNGWDQESDEADDLTAGDVFERLKNSEPSTSADSETVYRELVDEDPDAIAETADEPPAEPAIEDDDLLADEGALEDLLLSGRTEEDGFLWIEADRDEGEDDAAPSPVDGWMVDFAAEAGDEPDPTPHEGGETAQVEDDAAPEKRPLPIVDEDPESIALTSPERNEPADSSRDVPGTLLDRIVRLLRGLF